MSKVSNTPDLLSGNPLADFGTYFRKIIRPYLVDLEKKREVLKSAPKKQEKRLLTVAAIIGLFLAVSSYFMGLLGEYRVIFSLCLLAIPLMAMKYWLSPLANATMSQAVKEEYNEFYIRFKSKVVESLIKFFDQSLKLEYDKSISKDELISSGLVPRASELLLEGDDYASGKIDGMPVAFSELKISIISKEAEADLFHGLCLAASMRQIMDGAVYILPKVWLGGNELFKAPTQQDAASLIQQMAVSWGKVTPWLASDVRAGMPFHITLFHEKASKYYEVYTTNRLLAGKMASDQFWDLVFEQQGAVQESPLQEFASQERQQQAIQQFSAFSLVNGRLFVMQPQGTELFEPDLSQTFLDESGLMHYQQSLSRVLRIAKLVSLHVGRA